MVKGGGGRGKKKKKKRKKRKKILWESYMFLCNTCRKVITMGLLYCEECKPK